MTAEELLDRLARLRHAHVGGIRAPRKPLLLLWLFGHLSSTGSSVATYQEVEEPVSRLINEFGPPVISASAANQRAAMPFVHLERELWQVQDAAGGGIDVHAPERRSWLINRGAVGRLRPEVEQLLFDPHTLAVAARLLLEQHFTEALAPLICASVGLDFAALEARWPSSAVKMPVARLRRATFAEEVLRAYAYRCAMCGFDGALGRNPVGIEAAHVRWHSHDGPDDNTNALALCALHHVLLDLGVLGLNSNYRIRVSHLYVARSAAGRTIDALADRRLLEPRPGLPTVDPAHIDWHDRQVFKAGKPPSSQNREPV